MELKRRLKPRWLLVAVIVAELAVLDYCAVMIMMNGVNIEVIEQDEED